MNLELILALLIAGSVVALIAKRRREAATKAKVDNVVRLGEIRAFQEELGKLKTTVVRDTDEYVKAKESLNEKIAKHRANTVRDGDDGNGSGSND